MCHAGCKVELRCDAPDIGVAVAAGLLPFSQLFFDGIADEQGFGVLREQRLALGETVFDAASLDRGDTCDDFQEG